MSPRIDLNSDIGESFGAWRMGDDAGVLAHVTSANIACGFHAGDPATMRDTVALAVHHGVAVGAHVALPDLQGFGRREMRLSAAEVHALTLYQLGALAAFAHAAGQRLRHLKPHGALYNMAARERALADAIAQAVRAFDPRLVLVGLADSELTHAGERAGLAVAHEAFADRGYAADGTLLPRAEPGALLDSPDEIAAQAVAIATRGQLRTRAGALLRLRADTLCVHGDRADAARIAAQLRHALDAAGVRVASLANEESR
ncbi:MAG: LamB/YcsF family protein [Dokdonella sp.]|nr:MAG: LamB/YcsF family protein [Dokdonella sp.]